MNVLGIDIGGTGIKGAPVNLETGQLTGERYRLKTPKESNPENVAKIVHKIINHFDWSGKVGIGFPGVVRNGIIWTAANLDKGWKSENVIERFSGGSGCQLSVINDADAAGLAEMKFGAGKGRKGKVMLFTLGTGIGSALFLNGKLVSNTEFGHLEIRGKRAELRASERVRIKRKLSWKTWGKRVAEYFEVIDMLLSPNLIIIGGGASNHYKKFIGQLKIEAEVVKATSGNLAGIVGAALATLPRQ